METQPVGKWNFISLEPYYFANRFRHLKNERWIYLNIYFNENFNGMLLSLSLINNDGVKERVITILMQFGDECTIVILWENGASVRGTAALARYFSYFHFGAVGVKWGCKRSDRIYPAEKWPGLPFALIPLCPGEAAYRVKDLNFRIRFISRRPDSPRDPGGAPGHRKRRGCVVNAGTKRRRDGQAARHCRPLVYEPGVRFHRVDSILFATIYSAKDLRAYTRED